MPVTERALIQRINRVLKKQDEVLKATRGARARQELGDFYILDFNRNRIIEKNVDPEEVGKELKVLLPYERLVREGSKP